MLRNWDGACDLEVPLHKKCLSCMWHDRLQDLEISELRRRLKAERGVRKACEKWLKAELKSRVGQSRTSHRSCENVSSKLTGSGAQYVSHGSAVSNEVRLLACVCVSLLYPQPCCG